MARKHFNDRAGFTLIEMVVVLGLTCLLLGIGTFGARHIAQRTTKIEAAFFSELKENWQVAQFKARQANEPLLIKMGKEQSVLFQCRDWHQRIKVPTTLALARNYELKMTTKGNVRPMTIIWYSDVGPAEYRQTVQMGWGIYRVDRKVQD
ncbi:hypothetical protein LOSG293_170140 [Secundilactobacillus oryzae JCM 18671]|uniref:Prepilin-type N-terminal cleavage/methylation domain-containing protein n=1 Tax=Secundilactobacillus oryzae JCM 18671 TaxID=1291743 RepID=A0A081BIZ4_9LACO|nr:prepilin-type N-terminal cleavage/methylation domain-containing protein [Secundilactobacillus oryzae]GAK48012.1 hypothetical protein LOSG293_170140 [Secundilactobacillus oryzae JCM 18671]